MEFGLSLDDAKLLFDFHVLVTKGHSCILALLELRCQQFSFHLECFIYCDHFVAVTTTAALVLVRQNTVDAKKLAIECAEGFYLLSVVRADLLRAARVYVLATID